MFANVDRVGVKALVLEQSGGLRTEGTSLSLFPNAWRALDALGVADKLRGSFVTITGYSLHSHLKIIQTSHLYYISDPLLVEDDMAKFGGFSSNPVHFTPNCNT